jgi:hypothetical protein
LIKVRAQLLFFGVGGQCFPLTTFQHKHQYKPNFSISEQGVSFLENV